MPSSREAQSLAIADKFLSGWRRGQIISSSDFVSIYSPSVVWLDHLFQLHFMGTAAVDQLRKRWCGDMECFSLFSFARARANMHSGFALILVAHQQICLLKKVQKRP
jgi:hypothetical protein